MIAFLWALSWVCFCIAYTSALIGLPPRSYMNTSSSSITSYGQVSPSSPGAAITFTGKTESETLESISHNQPAAAFTGSEHVDRINKHPPFKISKAGINTADAAATAIQQLSKSRATLLRTSNTLQEEERQSNSLRDPETESIQDASVTAAPPSGITPQYSNATSPTRTYLSSSSSTTSGCSSRRLDEPYTMWIVLPNPTTITRFEGSDYPSTLYSSSSEFTPPVYCPDPNTGFFPNTTDSTTSSEPTAINSSTSEAFPIESIGTPFLGSDEPTTTFITTSKNPVIYWVTPTPPLFPDGGKTRKKTVDPATARPLRPSLNSHPSQNLPPVADGLRFSQTTFVPIANSLQPTNVVIIDGAIFSAIGSSIVIFDGQTLTYVGVTTFTTIFHDEAITIGTVVSFDGTTLGGAKNFGTQLGIAGGITLTQIGQSVGVISSTSFTVGHGVVSTTIIIDEYTITARPEGLELAGITISYPFNPSMEANPAEGLTFHKLDSTVAVISGSTYIPGVGFAPSSTILNRHSISSGSASMGFTGTPSIQASSSNILAPETATEASQRSAAGFSDPMYSLLGICFILCIGNFR